MATASGTTSRPTGRIAFTYPSFTLYQIARSLIVLATEMQSVAVMWQIYEITNSQLDLGLVGLVQFLPGIIFLPLSGHTADRYNRSRVLTVGYVGLGMCSALLLAITLRGAHTVYPIYVVIGLVGVARSFTGPASRAILPLIVPEEHFEHAFAWGATFFEIATILGPAVGGLVYTIFRGPAKDRIDQAADGGAEDRGDLKECGAPGERVFEMLFRDDERQDRAAGWAGEGARDAHEPDDNINWIHRVRTAKSDREQQRRAHPEADVADGEDSRAVVAVGGVSRERQENDSRQKLHEADEAKVQLAVGDFVDLPHYGDGLHLGGENDEGSRDLVQREGRIGEGDASSGPGGRPGSGGHRTSSVPQNENSHEAREREAAELLRGFGAEDGIEDDAEEVANVLVGDGRLIEEVLDDERV